MCSADNRTLAKAIDGVRFPGRQPRDGALQVIHTILCLQQRIDYLVGAMPPRMDTRSCQESNGPASSQITQKPANTLLESMAVEFNQYLLHYATGVSGALL